MCMKIYKNNKNTKKYRYIEMYVEKYLCENIKEYIKNKV